MKKCLILSVMLSLGLTALACGPWMRPMYFVFSAYDRQMMKTDKFSDQFKKFWVDYTGKENAEWSMETLHSVDLQEFEKSDNLIVSTAVGRGDDEMQQYLRVLISYLQVSDAFRVDQWEYPSKAEIEKYNVKLEYLNNRARAYNGNRLKSQYALMVMRTNMMLNRHAENVRYWTLAQKQLPDNAYKQLMRNIYAGALLNTGKPKEACDIYAEQGDMMSLKWMMRDNRDLNGIKQEYNRDPNAPTLVFLVQDFVNNGSQTLLKRYDYQRYLPEYTLAANAEMKQFIDFAQQVVKEGKTHCPALWQSAAGYLTHELGNTPLALNMLDKAMKMKGTPRMKDNARVCRWIASLGDAKNDKKYTDYFLKELKWVETLADQEYKQGNNAHYTEVLTNMMYDRFPEIAKKLGDNNLAVSAVAWMSHKDNQYICPEDKAYMSGELWSALNNLSSQEMQEYWSLLKNTRQGSNLQQYLNQGMGGAVTDVYFNDQVGTKLLREGNYQAAIPFLEKVPIDYISQQGISAYMAKRDFNVERWFKRQKVYTGDYWDWDARPMPVKSNQKIDFCRKVIDVQKQYASAQGLNRAQKAYQLASLYYQASYKGDCWYLTRYTNSVYDSLQYKGEKDLVDMSYKLLEESVALGKQDRDLYQKTLYAKAFFCIGEPYRDSSYDDQGREVWHLNTNTQQYADLLDLSRYLDDNASSAASYITRCDVLKTFRKMTK